MAEKIAASQRALRCFNAIKEIRVGAPSTLDRENDPQASGLTATRGEPLPGLLGLRTSLGSIENLRTWHISTLDRQSRHAAMRARR